MTRSGPEPFPKLCGSALRSAAFTFNFKLSTADFFSHFSVGNPASFQPFHPPSIDSTFV
jgi:hypothetical protein